LNLLRIIFEMFLLKLQANIVFYAKVMANNVQHCNWHISIEIMALPSILGHKLHFWLLLKFPTK